MTIPVNTATPSGFIGQTLYGTMLVTVPGGASFNPSILSITTNAPGAVVTAGPAPTGPNPGTNIWPQPFTVSSPNATGTYLVSGSVNGVDEQDVAVTWQPLPTETVVFDPAGFSFK